MQEGNPNQLQQKESTRLCLKELKSNSEKNFKEILVCDFLHVTYLTIEYKN